MRIVITGGHHSSALPFIAELLKRQPNTEIIWFGHKHTLKGDDANTLEYIEITKLNIPFYNLIAGKFYKTYDPVRLLKIPVGFFHALYLLLKVRPDVIMSFGGYMAVPTVIAGWILGIPSFTHEQTIVTGWANKVISFFAKKTFISWENSRQYFPANKVVYSGLPIRKEIFERNSNIFLVNEMLPTIYITAGKTGSHIINKAVLACLEELLSVANVIHQCGDSTIYTDQHDLKKSYQEVSHKVSGKYFLEKFILFDTIGEAFSKADMLIIRGGAHTVYEAMLLQKPSIIIPIPWVSHNEQLINAQFLEEAGLGYILEEKHLSGTSLSSAVRMMLDSLNKYKVDPKYAAVPTPAESVILDVLYETLKKKST